MNEQRIRCRQLLDRVMTADEAAALIKDGMVLLTSGFTSAGYPNAVPQAVARLGAAHGLTLCAGASTGPELDAALTPFLARRYPFQSDKVLKKAINEGSVAYDDLHLGLVPKYIESGALGEPDFAIIECAMINEDGSIVPTLTLGASATMVACAKRVILEINTTVPCAVNGMHDVFYYERERRIPLTSPSDRIGVRAIPCDPDKVAAVVFANELGSTPVFTPPDETSKKIAEHIVKLLEREVARGALPESLAPLQSGVGAVANAVMDGLKDAGFHGLTMYTEVVQDAAFSLIESGIMDCASTTAISLSREGLTRFYADIDTYKNKLILRPQDISNNPEAIRRLNVIAMNTAVEADIYGNVNSTHILGSEMINGVGGSGDFARNAGLSIFMTPSTGKNGAISRIIPMVTHVDSNEHDVNVIVTEQGLADLRGLSPKERAELIIENCAHPDYRPILREYFEHAKRVSPSQHTPHDLERAFSMHIALKNNGSMR